MSELREMDDDEFKDPGLDRDEVRKLGALMCSIEEVAAYFNVKREIIEDFYFDDFRAGMDKGRINLRTWQMTEAQNGNIDMLKWLGQQYLGQIPQNK